MFELRQEMQLKLLLRQELKQELILQLQLLLKGDFDGYISFEDDDDIPLLQESLPFLILHESAHEAERTGRIIIPKYTDSQGFETGIDKGGLILGVNYAGYPPELLAESNCAIVERVLRNMEHQGYIDTRFIARLEAGLREHPRTDRLEAAIELAGEIGGSDDYRELVEEYRFIHRGTRLR